MASTLKHLISPSQPPSPTTDPIATMRGLGGLLGRSDSFVRQERAWEEGDKRAREAARERGAWRRALFLRGVCLCGCLCLGGVCFGGRSGILSIGGSFPSPRSRTTITHTRVYPHRF